MIKTPKILVFDSGAGGLSIAREILKRVPVCELVYAADNAYYPYGLKNDIELTFRIVDQIEKLHHKLLPDLVVIACNTASTLALDTLRKEFDCPFVGVVPAIKPAAKITQSGVIGVLATPATISRLYTQNLIQEFAAQHKVILYGSDVLVELAEKKISNGLVDWDSLANEFNKLCHLPDTDAMDTLVLACTHFPLLKEDLMILAKSLKNPIILVDSGEAVAERVKNLLTQPQRKLNQQHIEFLFSDKTNAVTAIEARYRAYLSFGVNALN